MKKVVALIVALIMILSSVPAVFAADLIYGDTDKNGNVDIIDVTTVQLYVAKLISLDDESVNLSDVDGDGSITIIDCTTVQLFMAKLIDHFPIEDMIQPETTPTEEVTVPTEEVTVPTEPVTEVDESQPNEMELEILRLVNIEREERGLSPVEFAYDYYECAKIRAQETNSIDTFSHTRPDGRDWYTVIKDLSAPSFWGAGENLAIYFNTAEQAVEGWMNSPGHRANILYEDFDLLAVAVCETEEYEGYYVGVQIFISSWDMYHD